MSKTIHYRGGNVAGFIALPIWGWAAIGGAVALLGLGVAVKVQTSRLDAAKAEITRITGEFEAFKVEVSRIGKEAQAKAAAEKSRQASVSQQRESSYEKRIADLASAYQRLCSESDSCSGRLPAVPDPARSPDAATRDKQLRDVLQHADEQTARLIELQQWVSEQMK
jgi:hypothetical protein